MDFPPLGTLRIASPDDAPRISVVATAAFRYSPLFEWERPDHEKYPEDTLSSYRAQFLNAIQSDDHIVLVQEDEYLQDESSMTTATIPANTGWTAPRVGQQVIVAVISIKLDPGSPHKGKMKTNNGNVVPTYPILPMAIVFKSITTKYTLTILHSGHRYKSSPGPGRDLNRRHYDDWSSISAAARKKNKLEKHSSVSMIVVHPAYWRRGHGTRLATWARDLARMNRIPQCVSAAPMSQGLFMSLGFEKVDEIVAEGDEDDPRGAKTLLLEFGREYRGGLWKRWLLRWLICVTKDSIDGLVGLTQRTLSRMQGQRNEKGTW
ncbi:hypothetical protein QBC41DRAFT_384663 [Cercophora samala]|uniref:N-acetyltransferase domain-containing protein n=1 Tax=Cercophora samala TaxID=330535 RepID=A0AA39YV12_9PEZI|nr:hypothetical protein QBC41DRAFT_384663 [Cercophora samala]